MTDIGIDPGAVPPATIPADIVQLVSHNNRLIALTKAGEIWWGSWPGESGPVTWVQVWPPPTAAPLPTDGAEPAKPPDEQGAVDVPLVSL